MAMKPQSFLMSVMSVSAGTAVAALHGPIHWGNYLLTALAVVFLHAGTNVVNDYFDYKNRVDTTAVPGGYATEGRVLVRQLLLPAHVLQAGLVLFALSVPIGVYLTVVRGPTVFALGFVGFLVGFFYTARPISFKYIALGEPAVFLMWGPLMVTGAYFVQRGEFSWQAIEVSLPFGIFVALVLLANNIRDLQFDGQVGIRTLATQLGRRLAVKLYQGLVVVAYVCTALLVIFGQLTHWSLIVLLSLPLAYKLTRMLRDKIPKDADARTAQLDVAFGVLFIFALIL
jgi:1,4-dihydroxy-2-naphthoate octaprenyltransferase